MKNRLFGMGVMTAVLLIILAVFATAQPSEEYPKFEGKLSISDRGIEMIKSIEGYIDRPMSDYSQKSIGYGCSTEFAQKHGFNTTYLSRAEADELILFVLEGMEKKLDSFLSRYGIVVNQYQYDALMSFTFNLGSNWMNPNTRLGEVLVNGNYTVNEFASAMGVYCHVTTADGPEVLDLLVDRRIREIKLFLYGAYELDDVPQKFCTLQFDAGDGEAETDIGFYQVDEPYQLLFDATPPELSDTYFVGWYTEDGDKLTADTIVSGSQTVYADWDIEEEDPELYFEGDRYISDLSQLPEKKQTSAAQEETEEIPEFEIITEVSNVFSDMHDDQWYYDYVNDLYNSGVIDGYEDGTFRPERTVTTGEALKMILLAAGYPEPERVEPHWATCYLDLALNEGILEQGDISNLDVPINRLLMAKIAANALRFERMLDIEPFVDTSNIYAVILYDHAIVEGYEDGTFRPDRSLTRAELAAIVWRISNYQY